MKHKKMILGFPRTIVVALGFALLILSAMTGERHDYKEYVKQWAHIFSGGNPWQFANGDFNGNAYGPAYLPLTWLWALHPLLPKLLMTLTGYITTLAIAAKLKKKQLSDSINSKWTFWMLGLPYLMIMCVYYCNIDVLVTICIVLALLLQERQRSILAGIALSSAILLKFFPLAILPFMLVRKPRWDWKLAWTTFFITTIAMTISYTLWGGGSLLPIFFASERKPSLLSIFFGLESLGIDHASQLSLPLIAISGFILFIYHIRRPLSTMSGPLLALLTVFSWYQIGHHQYYLPIVAISGLWVASLSTKIDTRILLSLRSLLIWLSVFSLFYVWTGSYNFGFFRTIKPFLCFPHLFFMSWYLGTLIMFGTCKNVTTKPKAI